MVADLHQERRQLILEHIGRYRITIRHTLEKLFFYGKSSNNTIETFGKQGLIQIRKNGFPGGISYYQLSRKSAKELAFPSHRARAPGDMALPRDLAILWFCCISETRCCRLEQVHLERLVGEPLQGDYCMETQDAHRLFQLHVVGANSDPSYCIKAIVKDMDQVDFCPELHLRFQRRHYGYVILVSSEGQRVATQRLLKPDKLKDRAKIVVSVVPTPSTLKESIKDSPKR